MSCLEHIGDPELGFLFLTFVEPPGGGSHYSWADEMWKAPLAPHFTPPQEAGLQTHPTPYKTSMRLVQARRIGEFNWWIFPDFKNSVCQLLYFRVHAKTHMCRRWWRWKTWPICSLHCLQHSSTMYVPVRRWHSSGSRNPTNRHSLVNISSHQKSQ